MSDNDTAGIVVGVIFLMFVGYIIGVMHEDIAGITTNRYTIEGTNNTECYIVKDKGIRYAVCEEDKVTEVDGNWYYNDDLLKIKEVEKTIDEVEVEVEETEREVVKTNEDN